MLSKNNYQERLRKMERKQERFSIRKFSVGAASVLIGVLFFMNEGPTNHVVHASDLTGQNVTVKSDTGNASAKNEVTQPKTETPAQTASNQVANKQEATPASVAPAEAVNSDAANLDAEKSDTPASEAKSDTAVKETTAAAKDEKATDKKDTTTLSLNIKDLAKDNALSAAALAASKATVTPAADLLTADNVTVDNAKDFNDVMIKGKASVINISNDISLDDTPGAGHNAPIIARNITIQSAPSTENTKYKLDFDKAVYGFQNTKTASTVTYKNISLYGWSNLSPIQWATVYNFDNADYTGAQSVYTNVNNPIVNYSGDNNIQTVYSYTFKKKDGTTYTVYPQNQEAMEIRDAIGGQINFLSGTTTLTTYDGHTLYNGNRSGAAIKIKSGATVNLNPHTATKNDKGGNLESPKNGKAYALVEAGDQGQVNIEKGGTLNINLEKNDTDKTVSGAIYLSSNSQLNNEGNINITQNGALDQNSPVISIDKGSKINVGKDGSISLNAQNLGNSSGSLMNVGGNVDLDAQSTFNVTADGTGNVTGVNLSGGTFTSDQPKNFNVDLSDNNNAALVKNGTINFTRVKTPEAAAHPLGKVDVTFDQNGKVTSDTITSQDRDTVVAVNSAINNPDNKKIQFVAAGHDVSLTNVGLHQNNHLTGTVASEGTEADPIYVTVAVNGSTVNVPVAGSYTLYTDTNGNITTTDTSYASEQPANGGNFDIDLSKLNLKDTDRITVNAEKDFVNAPTVDKTVAELRVPLSEDNDPKAKDLTITVGNDVPAANTTIENAAEMPAGTTYAWTTTPDTSAVGDTTGVITVTYKDHSTDEVTVKVSVESADKTALQADLTEAPSVKDSAKYKNASEEKKTAYDSAVTAGQTVYDNKNATQNEVNDAVAAIDAAKNNLDGKPYNEVYTPEAADNVIVTVGDNAPAAKSAIKNTVDMPAGTKYAWTTKLDTSVVGSTTGEVTITYPDGTTDTVNVPVTVDEANKTALQKAVDEAPSVEATPAYVNASENAKKNYTDAVDAGQTVLTNKNASQKQVDDATAAINKAKAALDGIETDKSALQAAVNEAPSVRDELTYKNADPEKKTAYDNAVTAGQQVLDDPNASQQVVNDATDAINKAKAGLNGQPDSNVYAPEADNVKIPVGDDVPDAKGAIKNVDAMPAGTTYAWTTKPDTSVVGNTTGVVTVTYPDGTDETVTIPVSVEAANKDNLKTAVDNAPTVEKTPAYINADETAKKNYTDAVDAGQTILDNPNATQKQVDDATDAINNALKGLNGQPDSDTYAPEADTVKIPVGGNVPDAKTAIKNSDAMPAGTTYAWTPAPETNVAGGTTGVVTVTYPDGSHETVTIPVNVEAANKDALQKAVDDAPTVEKTPAYENADETAKKNYTDAVDAGQTILDNPNATQKQVDDATDAINNALKGLNGQADSDTYAPQADTVKVPVGNDVPDAKSAIKNSDDMPAGTKYAWTTTPATNVVGNTTGEVTVTYPDGTTDTVNVSVTVEAANKDALKAAVGEAPTVETTSAYDNASEAAQNAYDDAVDAGQRVLDNPNATQTRVDKALKAINDAKAALDGVDTNKAALQAAVDEAPTVETTPKYTNASEAAQNVYDDAVDAGQRVLDNPNATQARVDKALKAINDAKAALDGQDTNKDALKTAVGEAPTVETTPKYANASEDAQDAYKSAVDAGQTVLDNPNASQAQVDKALKAINDAKAALDGQDTNKDALKNAVDEAPTVETTSAYVNADETAKKNYTDAVDAGQTILDNPNATQAQVDKATKAIDAAKAALDGKSDSEIYEPEVAPTVKVPVGDNVPDAKSVIVNADDMPADTKYEWTKTPDTNIAGKTTGEVTVTYPDGSVDVVSVPVNVESADKGALQTAVNGGPAVEASPAFVNGSEAAKKNYTDAVDAGENVLNNPSATQAQVDKATQAINDAKSALDGQNTDKTALQAAVGEAPTVETTSAYANAPQEKKNAYDNAVTAGENVLNNPSATQSQVDKATQAINDAKAALDGQNTDKTALQAAVDEAPTVETTSAYANAPQEKKNAYDNAVTAGENVLNNPSATQAQVDKATQAINNAKSALDGQNTDKTALQAAVGEAPTVETTPAYVYAPQEKKNAYDNAVTAGESILNNPNATQAQVDKATKVINDAKDGLDGVTPYEPAASSSASEASSAADVAKSNASSAASEASSAASTASSAASVASKATSDAKDQKSIASEQDSIASSAASAGDSSAASEAQSKASEAAKKASEDADMAKSAASEASSAQSAASSAASTASSAASAAESEASEGSSSATPGSSSASSDYSSQASSAASEAGSHASDASSAASKASSAASEAKSNADKDPNNSKASSAASKASSVASEASSAASTASSAASNASSAASTASSAQSAASSYASEGNSSAASSAESIASSAASQAKSDDSVASSAASKASSAASTASSAASEASSAASEGSSSATPGSSSASSDYASQASSAASEAESHASDASSSSSNASSAASEAKSNADKDPNNSKASSAASKASSAASKASSASSVASSAASQASSAASIASSAQSAASSYANEGNSSAASSAASIASSAASQAKSDDSVASSAASKASSAASEASSAASHTPGSVTPYEPTASSAASEAGSHANAASNTSTRATSAANDTKNNEEKYPNDAVIKSAASTASSAANVASEAESVAKSGAQDASSAANVASSAQSAAESYANEGNTSAASSAESVARSAASQAEHDDSVASSAASTASSAASVAESAAAKSDDEAYAISVHNTDNEDNDVVDNVKNSGNTDVNGMNTANAENHGLAANTTAEDLAAKGYVVTVGPDGQILDYYPAADGQGKISYVDANGNVIKTVKVGNKGNKTKAGNLPQTGAKDNKAGIFGLALASIAGIFGLAADKKRKKND